MEAITTDVFNKDNIQVVKGLLDESNVTKTIYVKLLFNCICIKINFYGYLDQCIPKTRFFTIFSILLYLLTITFPAYMGSIVSYEWLPNLCLSLFLICEDIKFQLIFNSVFVNTEFHKNASLATVYQQKTSFWPFHCYLI